MKGYVFRIHTRRGGGRSPTPHGANPGIVTGGKARGGGGRTGRRKPSGISPGAKVCLKERLSASLYLSTRDRTSLLLEESSQSLGSLIFLFLVSQIQEPAPSYGPAFAHGLCLGAYSGPRGGGLLYSRYVHPCTFQIHLSSGRAPSKLDLNVSPGKAGSRWASRITGRSAVS